MKVSSLPGGLQSKGAALLQRKTAPACLAQRGTAILTSRLLRHGGTSTAHSLSIQLLSSQLSSCRVAAPSPLLRKASASAAPGNIDAATATPPAAAIELDRSNPLVVALENAQGKQAEACQVREALEAEAQEVAQLAVEAGEKKDAAKERVFQAMANIEEATRNQQLWLERVALVKEKVDALQTDAAASSNGTAAPSQEDIAELAAAQSELAAAEKAVSDINASIASLRAEMEALYAQAVLAEAAALKAEEVAQAAMTAAETAVQEEMQADATVHETQAALEKLGTALRNMKEAGFSGTSAASAAGPAAAAAAPAAVDSVAGVASVSSLASMDGSEAPVSVSVSVEDKVAEAMRSVDGSAASPSASTTSSSTNTTSAPPRSEYEPASEVAPAQQAAPAWVKWAMLAVGAALGTWFLNSTDPGRALAAAAASTWESIAHKLPHIHIHENERGLVDTIVLLFTSIVCVPLVVKGLPGGNPVLGYLLGGALVGPYATGLISDVHSIKHLAEMGVVLLLFNIGLELSLDRLQSMAKQVFGMGTAQVIVSLLGVMAVAVTVAGLPIPSAVILGGAVAMSSTAVAIQVLEERGEMGARHGRACFSVLLFQDLAVVVLLMLIPLLAPNPDGSVGGIATIAKALGLAAIKAVVAIVGIIAGGRMIVQPLYKKISEFANAEIFAATTLLMVLGTSFLTQLAGLSLALGAFLAGLLIAETEYALQVESDIAPYKGLLMGLFFMSVGMEISGQLFMAKWMSVLVAITVLIVGKVLVMTLIGPIFGVSRMAATRAGLLLAPGGEFAFVAFGEAITHKVLPQALCNELILVVALSMALTPYLAMFGQALAAKTESKDVQGMQPDEAEMDEMRDHVLVLGYGRAGQLIGQMLSEQVIRWVAVDTNTEAVTAGRKKDYPVYFGDAGSPSVLHLLGAERAACAVIALDTPGANYRAVWAMAKHYPNVKLYVRAHDIKHGINLEKAGATAVVPETLEPSLQLVAAVLAEFDYKGEEVSTIVDDFRRKHLTELKALSNATGTTLGYGMNQHDSHHHPAPKKASKPASEGSGSGAAAGMSSLTPAAA